MCNSLFSHSFFFLRSLQVGESQIFSDRQRFFLEMLSSLSARSMLLRLESQVKTATLGWESTSDGYCLICHHNEKQCTTAKKLRVKRACFRSAACVAARA